MFADFSVAHKKVTGDPCTLLVDPLLSHLSPNLGRYLAMNNASIYTACSHAPAMRTGTPAVAARAFAQSTTLPLAERSTT